MVKKVNKINTTDTSNLVKKTDYNTNICEIENEINDHNHTKYMPTQKCNRLTSKKFTARLAEANLASKNDLAYFEKKTDFDNNLLQIKQKMYLLKMN